jgi:2-methylcitrate dehydratase
MDETTRRVAAFALEADYSRLDAASVHACKLRLIDTIGCALGAAAEPLGTMACNVAARSTGTPAARVWGTTIRSTPESAAFANGVMLRLLDISDTYLGKSRGHPSDVIAAVMAVADAHGCSGKAVLAAIALAYDVYCSLCDALDWNGAGWDQPVYGVVGAAAGAGRLLGLDHEAMSNAISLAIVPNMAMYQTRKGHLSSWKGCAGANAARNAVFAATLARDGFTGPAAPFEGDAGLFGNVGPGRWALPAYGSMIRATHIKSLPVCYHGQSAVLAAMGMHGRVAVDDIESIHVEAYRTAFEMMGNDPSRWAPTTHETADHSLPYTVAIALLDGAVTSASFDHARFTDPAVVALMKKTRVTEAPAFTQAYPEAAPGRVTLTLASGKVETAELRYPTGHARSPMSEADVERKFREMLAGHPAGRRSDEILQRLWAIEEAKDVGAEVLAVLGGEG